MGIEDPRLMLTPPYNGDPQQLSSSYLVLTTSSGVTLVIFRNRALLLRKSHVVSVGKAYVETEASGTPGCE